MDKAWDEIGTFIKRKRTIKDDVGRLVTDMRDLIEGLENYSNPSNFVLVKMSFNVSLETRERSYLFPLYLYDGKTSAKKGTGPGEHLYAL